MWMDGEVVPWGEATVHVWSELAIRGASVFEGLRCYWHAGSGAHYVIALDEHLARMARSAKIVRFPGAEEQIARIREGIPALVTALGYESDLYVRPTIYIRRGRYGFRPGEVELGAYIVAFPVNRSNQTFEGARVVVSSWRRASDLTSPPMAKVGAAYAAFRLPIVEAREAGVDDVVILNERGTVAETSGATMFVVRDGRVATPPIMSGILESITRSKAIALLEERLGVPVIEREILRNELVVADELFMTGTLAEIQPVIEVDGLPVGDGAPGTLTTRLRDLYLSLCEAGPEAGVDWVRRVGSS